MIRNYILIVLRHLSHQRIYALINILGLAFGMAVSFLIILLVRHELSYDQFHKNADRIYRVVEHTVFAGDATDDIMMPYPLADFLEQKMPEVEKTIRILHGSHKLVSYDTISYTASNFYYADPSFFEVFSFPLLEGNPHQVLQEPFTIVITESTARKYFGSTDPVGKNLHLDNGWNFRITGICADVPSNAHFHFDFMASYKGILHALQVPEDYWGKMVGAIYVLLREKNELPEAQKKLDYLTNTTLKSIITGSLSLTPDEFDRTGNQISLYLQPLTSIHLNSHALNELEPNSSRIYIYIFIILAVLILTVACLNFMNLGTARSSVRAREISLRKVMGANRTELIIQFLSESVVLSLLALILALVIIEVLIQPFSEITGRNLPSFFVHQNLVFIPWLILGTIVLGIVSGLWPALFLSTFRITSVLRGVNSEGRGAIQLRRSLVLSQFTLSLLFIICTMFVVQQVKFYHTKNLGFDKDNLLIVRRAYALMKNQDKIRQSLLDNPSITGVTFAYDVPGRNQTAYTVPFRQDSSSREPVHYLRYMAVDNEFARTLGLKMAAGTFFISDTTLHDRQIVINETAVHELGLSDPIGKKLYMFSDEKDKSGKERKEFYAFLITGIVRDFNYESLHTVIKPLVLFEEKSDYAQYLVLRYSPGEEDKVLPYLRKTWTRYLKGQPFEYFYVRSELDKQYHEEQMTARLLSLFSGLSIFIAILGLLGLVSFTADRKIREIGIRKSMGATVEGIIIDLVLQFLRCVFGSMLIAFPVAGIGIYFILRFFPYHISINLWIFAIAGIIAILISVVTVIFQSVKSARSNPAYALRYE